MSLPLPEEQEEFRSAVRGLLARRSRFEDVRRLMEGAGHDAAVWKELADQLGLQGLLIGEEHGGQGFDLEVAAIAFEEAGRALLCAPLLPTVLVTVALVLSDDPAAQERFLPGLASGETIATITDVGRDDGALAAVAGRGPEAVLEGSKDHVLDGGVANLALVLADGNRLYAVDLDAPGIRRRPLETMDQTRRQVRLEFNDAAATPVGGDAGALLDAVMDRAAVLLAAEQVGGAARALEMAVGYAKDREQFGRPIGSFQAIKHKCADMLVAVESARSAVYAAAQALAAGDPEGPLLASMVKAAASEAYVHATAENIQIHGGVGYTWEHDAHLLYKRSTSSEVLFGDPASHRQRVASLLAV
jgi:alkylation response protein AidB-like acyl-CoA dehydrogenase